jgi:hypothetical protein
MATVLSKLQGMAAALVCILCGGSLLLVRFASYMCGGWRGNGRYLVMLKAIDN